MKYFRQAFLLIVGFMSLTIEEAQKSIQEASKSVKEERQKLMKRAAQQ